MPPGATPGPPSPMFDPPGAPKEPPRASWWSVAAVLATVVVGAVLIVSASTDDADGATRAMTAIVLGIGLGALVANLTPVGTFFRRWSAIPIAIVAYLVLMIAGAVMGLGGMGGGNSEALGYMLLASFFMLASLDLCYVSRLRVMVILTGLCMLPVIASLESTALFSAFAWFAAAGISFWVLSVDEQRSLARPEPIDGLTSAPTPKAADLIRTIAMATLAGFTLAFLLSTPSCTPNLGPVGRLFDWIPWHPQPSPEWGPGIGEPVMLHELDEDGHELSTYLDVRGRRFIIDPGSGESYAVMDRERGTIVEDRFGFEVARFEDGQLVARTVGGDEVAYDRDSRWHLIGRSGERFDLHTGRSGSMELSDSAGGVVGFEDPSRPGAVRLEYEQADLDPLDANGDGMLAIPRRGIIAATTGDGLTTNQVEHGDDWTYVIEPGTTTRTYEDAGDSFTVEVDPAGEDIPAHSYRIDRGPDVLTAFDPDGNEVLTLAIDREGNALEGIDGDTGEVSETPDVPEPGDDGDRPSPPWKMLAIVVAVLAAIGAGVAWYVWWRRRGDDDAGSRDWAEQQVARIEAWGRDHTFPRESAESVVRYAARLDHEIARDGTLLWVVEVLDGALFGHQQVPMDRRLQVEAAIDRLLEDHPKPGRAERLRGGPDHGIDREPVG
jgi:hypothetical protein